MNHPKAREITKEIASYAVGTRYDALPDAVQKEGARTFLNWMGCVLGGCHDAAVDIADSVVAEAGGNPLASVIGRGRRANIQDAAFLNCLSSTVNSFDDTHLATVTHPTGPVAAALFAYSEKHAVSGQEFVNALVLGIEIECRLSNVLLMEPAQANLGLFITGITGPIGAAVALGRLMQFDEERMRWAIGIAATQACGVRATHGAMGAFFVPAHAARSGVWGAMLAQKGFTSTDHVLEGAKGLVEIFAGNANLDLAVEGLGQHFELLANAYKPYPSGIVVQPVIDSCLEIAPQIADCRSVASVKLMVHPLALNLTGRREPKNPVEAQISLFHWAAACLLQRTAGLAQLSQQCIDDSDVAQLRARIEAIADKNLERDEAIAEVLLVDGRVLRAHVAHARGSKERPMTDAELDAKFTAQAVTVLSSEASDQLRYMCRNLAALHHTGDEIGRICGAM